MALWLVRCGRFGEYESRFLDDQRIYLTWGDKIVDRDLRRVTNKESLREHVARGLNDASPGKVSNHTGQISAFLHRMKPGDWVCAPTKRRTIHIGEILDGCAYEPGHEADYRIYRPIRWLETNIPRTAFDQDILNSLGAIMTICQIKRNDAEQRIRAMANNNWRSTGVAVKLPATTSSTDPGSRESDEDTAEASETDVDLNSIAQDHISRMLYAKYKGHGMELLVKAILEAQGFEVHHSDKGPDGGIDLLAAPGVLGFGSPRVCVQVKSQDSPLDRPVLDQLVGTMQHVQAEQGLLVCWGGFKKTVTAELPRLFFKVRLWDHKDLLDQFLTHYGNFNEDMRTAVPLKRIWAAASPDATDAGA